jgi:very-long-chain (3R)-3-hydroxyacyl-CoA dehydratase
LAVLEIVHTILRWVKSPVGSTFAQVASRIFVVVLIYMFYCQNNITDFARKGIYIVSVAWSVTELVRYSFYALSLLGRQPAFLLWMRYTFFIVLYPLGVTGEWFIILAPIVAKGILLDVYTVFTAVVFLAYAYYFPVLYGYMWKQRRAKIT